MQILNNFEKNWRNGFEMAIHEVYSVPNDKDINLSNIYRFRSVHYKRSVNRAARNGALIPAEDSAEFLDMGMSLADDSISLQ